jgi:hypothetical protein
MQIRIGEEMSLRRKKMSSEKPITTPEELRKARMAGMCQQLRDRDGNIISDEHICGTDGNAIDTNLIALGSPETGTLVGSVKMRGDRLEISPDQLMHKGKVYRTDGRGEVPYGYGTRKYVNEHFRA